MKTYLQDHFGDHYVEAVSLIVSITVAIIAFIINVAVWQFSITGKVAADDTSIQQIQTQLSIIQSEVTQIDSKSAVNTQKTSDIQNTVNLIYQHDVSQ